LEQYDARPKILAYVIYNGTKIVSSDVKEIPKTDIDVAEALTVEWLLEVIKSLDWEIAFVGLDNSCVGWAMHKGWSPSPDLHEVMCRIISPIGERIVIGVDIPSVGEHC